jgi:DNA-binding transcriptional LysR family regulator
MDKHALVLFADVVEQGSFAAAARLNNLPTTSVSRSIQQLEAQLSGRPLNRTTRSLSLTELGEQGLPNAQLLRETISQVASLAEQQLERPNGRLKVSATRSYALSVLQPWLVEFNAAYPDNGLMLDLSSHYVDLNAAGIDFAFRLGPLKDSSISPYPSIRFATVWSQVKATSLSANH